MPFGRGFTGSPKLFHLRPSAIPFPRAPGQPGGNRLGRRKGPSSVTTHFKEERRGQSCKANDVEEEGPDSLTTIFEAMKNSTRVVPTIHVSEQSEPQPELGLTARTIVETFRRWRTQRELSRIVDSLLAGQAKQR